MVRHAQYVMGTLVEVTGYSHHQDEDSLRALLQEAMREFESLERVFNRFDSASEFCRVNREARATDCPVSETFFEIVEQGLSYSRLSGGSFSIALDPLTRLWSDCAEQQRWPAVEKVNRALRLSDHRLVELDSRRGTIRFGLPGMGLNLDGFVKGIATDRARVLLQKNGIPQAVINAGTSSLAIYSFSNGETCRIGLRHPSENDCMVAILAVSNAAISSSGTGPQAYFLGGRCLSHLIDPENGYPLEGMLSATAVTDSAALAEVASKMLLFRGLPESAELFEKADWDVDGIRLQPSQDGQPLHLEYQLSPRTEVEVPHDSCSTLSE